METWAPQPIQLDARSHFNMTLNTSAVRDSPWMASNSTREIIAGLKLQQMQTLRTMHLTIGVFSLVVALATVYRIVSDARRTAAAVQYPVNKARFSFLQSVHPAEIFPLVQACGAVLQQIIFVSVQSTSLRDILSNSCRGIAMITFPAIFLIAYITLVFGIEMALRAYKSERFAPRGKWNTSICIAAVTFLILMTWIPTVAWPMPNRCFGSLIWYSVRYELIAIVIISILVFFFLLLAGLISFQLMRTPDVDANERIAASRMCYYLLMAALVYALVLPQEIEIHRREFKSALTTARVAEVALFASGIIIGFFHLFLRANATRMVISPINKGPPPSPATKKRRPRLRFFGPSDLEMNISGPLALQGGPRPDSRQGLIELSGEKSRYEMDASYFVRPEKPLSPGSMKSVGPMDPTKWPLPPDPVPIVYKETKQSPAPGLHKRNKSSYSLFPTRAEDIPRLPATVYSPPKPPGDSRISKLALRRQARRSSLGDTKSVTDINEAFNFLSKPPPLFSGRHRREQSTDSSATVQIGLRFSVAPATLAAAKCTAHNRQVGEGSPPPIRRDHSESSVDTLGLPIQAPSSNLSNSTQSSSVDLKTLAFPQPPQRAASPPKNSPSTLPPLPAHNSNAYLQSRIQNKVLPPTPRSAGPGAPPSQPPPRPPPPGISGLRMNPVSPSPSSAGSSPATTPRSVTTMRTMSPTARIPGTMSSSPQRNGWI